jgi:hypothetical protein
MTDSTTGSPPGGLRRWAADLAMGMRFALGGGKEGWIRTALTATGVGLGVVVLLVASAVPHMITERQSRTDARENYGIGRQIEERSDRTLLYQQAQTEFRGEDVRGRVLQPEGAKAPVPPGVDRLPAPGDMVVSPALKELLASPGGELLRERLPARITGTIADEGLEGPSELAYYAGSDELAESDNAYRIDRFGSEQDRTLHPVLLLLITVICVVLLLPVGAFVAAAVRFGGERRDRRLAALRLVGADVRMTRRVAAGEAATGALLGLLLGAALFVPLRPTLATFETFGLSMFVSDVQPDPLLATLIVLAVPACAILVSLLALRGVAIEPLGVVRRSTPKRRRLWWRVAPPVLGFGLLVPFLDGDTTGDTAETAQVAFGIVLVLVGVTALLPWVVESAVRAMRGGRLPFQLAVRRLQVDSGTAARTVSGITVAVAGAVALQMLFSGVGREETEETGQDPTAAEIVVFGGATDGTEAGHMAAELAGTRGVRQALGTTRVHAVRAGEDPEEASWLTVTVADCVTLRRLMDLRACADGDVFVAEPDEQPEGAAPVAAAAPGMKLDLDPPDTEEEKAAGPVAWTVPSDAREVDSRPSPTGGTLSGVLATPGALDVARLSQPSTEVYVRIDRGVADAVEYVRNTAAREGGADAPYVMELRSSRVSTEFRAIQRGLYAGATGILLLIGASMIVSTLEQLRDRKRLLSVLVAFGTRRSTLAWSVLWQTALPVLLGLGLAAAAGMGLGLVLLRMADIPLEMDWAGIGGMTGLGGSLILLVTAASMPLLWRLMRPEGLRTE